MAALLTGAMREQDDPAWSPAWQAAHDKAFDLSALAAQSDADLMMGVDKDRDRWDAQARLFVSDPTAGRQACNSATTTGPRIVAALSRSRFGSAWR